MKNDTSIEASFPSIFLLFLGSSYILLSILRFLNLVQFEQSFLVCLAISGFCFIARNYFIMFSVIPDKKLNKLNSLLNYGLVIAFYPLNAIFNRKT